MIRETKLNISGDEKKKITHPERQIVLKGKTLNNKNENR